MKKISIFLLGVFCAALLSVCAFAAGPVYNSSPSQNEILRYELAYETIYDAAASGAQTADLSSCRITDEEAVQVYADLIASAPEFFFLSNKIYIDYVPGIFGNSAIRLTFTYLMNPKEREAASIVYENELSRIAAMVDPNWSEAEKALFVHDYLISVYSYDESGTTFDTYNLITSRKGVCQAYSLFYAAILRELGMEAVMTPSPDMNHAWNQVKVDGVWYHVDLIYDDPRPDRTGRVLHDFFLISDEEMREKGHTGWRTTLPCPQSYPGSPLWDGICSRIVPLGGRWYFIDPVSHTLSSSAFDGSDRTQHFTFTNRWRYDEDNRRFWVGTFSGLSEYQGSLILNTPSDVLVYDPAAQKTTVWLTADAGEYSIYGSTVVKNQLEYVLSTTPNLEGDEPVLSREISSLVPGLDAVPLPFDDVTRLDPYYDAVKFVQSRGLFQGISPDKFAPDTSLTRAMFVTVLGRLCGVDPADYASSSFTDVEPGLWYSPYVEWAAQAGIVNGVGGGRFDPTGILTHEQMYRIVASCGQMLNVGVPGDGSLPAGYTDLSALHDWARDGVSWCFANGLLPAGTSLSPTNHATRAESAVIIAAFAEMQ